MGNNIKLKVCPSDLQYKFKYMVTYYCDGFCEDVFRQPIRGFSFHVDKGDHPPICYKTPRYVPHEYEVMLNMLGIIYVNGVVEEYNVPWGALLVLYAKPYQ